VPVGSSTGHAAGPRACPLDSRSGMPREEIALLYGAGCLLASLAPAVCTFCGRAIHPDRGNLRATGTRWTGAPLPMEDQQDAWRQVVGKSRRGN
jgi:hypothetical protein